MEEKVAWGRKPASSLLQISLERSVVLYSLIIGPPYVAQVDQGDHQAD